jgi:phosphohistidine swiveling domain-containing protein
MTPLQTLYRCADGSDFPVTWEDPAHAAFTFRWNQDHFPAPWRPLAAALQRSREAGRMRAHEEAGVPPPFIFRPELIVNGFEYTRTTPLPPDEEEARRQAAARFTQAHGGSLNSWERFCRPRIQVACARLQQADDATPLAHAAELEGYGRALTFVGGHMYELLALVAFLAGEVGEGETLALALTQGHPNATLAVDQALWDLAARARRAPEVERAILDAPPGGILTALRAIDAREFLPAFDGLLARYGWRAEGWDLACPTWRERPETPLALVRRLLAEGAAAPQEATRAGAMRRETLIADTEARLGDADKRARFRELLAPLADYVAIREDRALWQLTLSGSLRGALLRHGERLARAGQIDTAEDVFFLLPDEIDAGSGDRGRDFGALVAARRREWQTWAARTPPATIGGEGPAPPPTAATAAAEAGLIRGIAASRGVYTGRARVLHDPYDSDALAAGDVLVCVMTTPAWTPLFGLAGAIVTDSGMAMSHPAIAAREYGIPAVVGARDATRRIPDGALITVDGTTGVVRLET